MSRSNGLFLASLVQLRIVYDVIMVWNFHFIVIAENY